MLNSCATAFSDDPSQAPIMLDVQECPGTNGSNSIRKDFPLLYFHRQWHHRKYNFICKAMR